MRFFAAVLVGGVAFGALMPGMPAEALLSRWSLLRVLVLVLVAFLIGLVLPRRGWIAAAAAYCAWPCETPHRWPQEVRGPALLIS